MTTYAPLGESHTGGRLPIDDGSTRAAAPMAHPLEARDAKVGALIVNADDWGRDRFTTDRTLDCVVAGAVTAVSAMVFMEDSERSAAVAREAGIDAGLHLNLTTAFSGSHLNTKLTEHHVRVSKYLRSTRFSSVIYHPALANSFKYVVAAQLEEFGRIYGTTPDRIDGHHHMHQCANVLLGKLLPAGTMVRRNFTFAAGEKSLGNRLYRKLIDRLLAKRHRLTDLFFSLPPLEPRKRLERIFSAAEKWTVELETHPAVPAEYEFLAGGELFRWTAATRMMPFRSIANVK